MVIMQGQIIKDLMLQLCIVSNTLNMKILRHRLTDYVKISQKLFFLQQWIKSLISGFVIAVADVTFLKLPTINFARTGLPGQPVPEYSALVLTNRPLFLAKLTLFLKDEQSS